MDNITDGQLNEKLNGHRVFDPFSLSFAKDMNSILEQITEYFEHEKTERALCIFCFGCKTFSYPGNLQYGLLSSKFNFGLQPDILCLQSYIFKRDRISLEA